MNCSFCEKSGATKHCGRCKKAGYCDASCQTSHWKTHGPTCKEPAKEPANSPFAIWAQLRNGESLFEHPFQPPAGSPVDLPDLYAGPPGWLDDPTGEKVTRLLDKLGYNSLKASISHYKEQRDLDHKWSLLSQVYASRRDQRRTLTEHAVDFNACGWDISSVIKKYGPTKVCDFDLIIMDWDEALLPNVRPSIELSSFCEQCRKPCKKECRCGVNFCSRLCQIVLWSTHKGKCREMAEEHKSVLLLNELFWKEDLAIRLEELN